MACVTVDAYTSHAQVKRLFSKHAVDDHLEDVAEVQQIVRGGTPTSGSFTLTYGSETSQAIAYDADQYAFELGMRSIYSLRRMRVISTTGTTPNLTHRVQFVDITGDASAITADTSGLAGGTPTVTITTLQVGDSDALDDAIIMACMEILKYVERYYSVTQLLRSNLVNQWATWLSCYYLSGRKGNDPPKVFAREFERILKQLMMILSGAMNIPEILRRRSSAISMSNTRANPRYNFRVLRIEKGTSSKITGGKRQITDYEEAFSVEL